MPESDPTLHDAQARGGPPRRLKFLRRFFKGHQELRIGWMILDALTVLVLIALGVAAKPAYRDDAGFRAAIVPLLIQRGQCELAEKSLRVVMGPADGPMVKLELLRVLCSRPSVEHVVEAQRIFADLIAAHADDASLAALLILGDAPLGLVEGEPLPDLPKWLESQPKPPPCTTCWRCTRHCGPTRSRPLTFMNWRPSGFWPAIRRCSELGCSATNKLKWPSPCWKWRPKPAQTPTFPASMP